MAVNIPDYNYEKADLPKSDSWQSIQPIHDFWTYWTTESYTYVQRYVQWDLRWCLNYDSLPYHGLEFLESMPMIYMIVLKKKVSWLVALGMSFSHIYYP